MEHLPLDNSNAEPDQITESIAWHWYDLTCPFCYVSKSRNMILKEKGYNLIELPFQAHPEVPPEGIYMGKRNGPMYELLEREAREANLPLNWPVRLPNSGYALAMAEQVRRHLPPLFPKVKNRLYAAHFALNEDLGSREVVHHCLRESGIKDEQINKWPEDPAFEDLRSSQLSAEGAGVSGTPAWMVNHQLVLGLQSHAFFQNLKQLD